MHRLFVGIRPPAAIRAALIATMSGVEGARWQDDDQLHITLRYIGEVERPVAEDVAAMLGQVRGPSFDLALQGVGLFDRGSRRPTALWAGVRPHDAIRDLHHKIDRAVVRAGLEPERRAYLPHITLARIGGGGAVVDPWLAVHAGLASEMFTVSHFLLFESHLGREGARYEAIARYALD
ncbi:RNA 2',3'-cyclic phosphodiesterase [Sphingomonas sp. AX6]|uniref:RNA 2',3'-cyclic phosphodiesterase n=1 Tax=Sphingomonas sp. AX6 TaxID=2653171 RepID=UPI001358AED8|nr:RNA 2',3'-cyclic phosphodiesterase [Sphingomonas sp. AX6]